MYKQRVTLFLSIIICTYSLAIGIIFLAIKFPLYIPAEYWIKEAIIIKEHYAKTIKEPKIIIISGSNSLFGICTPLLKEKTNKEIVNFGLAFSVPIEVLFALIKRNANPNDIILMPLEYNFYCQTEKLTKLQITHLTTWGTEFIQEFQIGQIPKIIFHSIPSIPERIKNFNFNLPIRTYKEYMQNKNPKAILAKSYGLQHSINYYGDNLADIKPKVQDVPNQYLNTELFENFRFQQLKDFADYLAKQNVQLMLTYPVTMKNPAFDLIKQEHLHLIEILTNKIKRYGLAIIGIPELSNFESTYSCDFSSSYHLNAEGAILRSLYLADTINCYLAGIPQEIADLEEYKNEKKAEAKKILEEYRKLGYFSE